MTKPRTPRTAPTVKPRRADAERSVAAILEAALEALTSDPDASMAEIARRAGVVRATIYVHFPTRESLVTAVTERAIADVAAALAAAEPATGEPAEALRRVLRATWRELDRFHALVSLNANLPHSELHRLHAPVLKHLQPLIERGQRDGVFRQEVPAVWHLSMLLAIAHAASGEMRAGRLPAADVEDAMLATALGGVAAPSPKPGRASKTASR